MDAEQWNEFPVEQAGGSYQLSLLVAIALGLHEGAASIVDCFKVFVRDRNAYIYLGSDTIVFHWMENGKEVIHYAECTDEGVYQFMLRYKNITKFRTQRINEGTSKFEVKYEILAKYNVWLGRRNGEN